MIAVPPSYSVSLSVAGDLQRRDTSYSFYIGTLRIPSTSLTVLLSPRCSDCRCSSTGIPPAATQFLMTRWLPCVLCVIIARLVSTYPQGWYYTAGTTPPSLSSSPIRCSDEVIAVLSPSPLPLASLSLVLRRGPRE